MILHKTFIILFSLSLFINTAHGKTHTNKTYFSPRSHLSNMAMEFSSWHTLLVRPDHTQPAEVRGDKQKSKNKFPGTLQATGFYQSSNNKFNLGQYFGYYAEKEKKIRDFISVDDFDRLLQAGQFNDDLDGVPASVLIHIQTGQVADFGGKIKFTPKQQTYGARLDYHQSFKDFFFQVGLPIVNVENDMGATAIGKLGNLQAIGNKVVLGNDHPNIGKTLADFLRGEYELLNPGGAFNSNQQKALTHAKISGKQSTGGVADIAIKLGYNLYNKKGNRIAFYANGVIPTGNTADGVYLFEPIYGNGNHWGFGGGVDSKLELWKQDRDTIELLTNLNLTYLFKNDEKRTLSIIDDNKKPIDFGHYYLGGRNGENALFPLANVLTRNIDVEPGLQFEGLLGLVFRTGNFTFDIGYNLFAKEAEHIFLKDRWEEDQYAIAHEHFDTAAAFDVNVLANIYEEIDIDHAIRESNLDLESVMHPSTMTHKIYTSFGYEFKDCKYPLMLGVGTSYEVVSSGNTGLENFAILSKVGVSF